MGSRLDNNADAVRKRIAQHTFDGDDGDEYSGSAFGGFNDYFRRKKIKLQNLDADIRARAGDCPPIFSGVVAHVNGYTQPSLNDLHTLIVQHGGGFLQYLDGKTSATHIIASSLTPKKAVEFRRYRIVKPAWVVDSVAAGTLLPWAKYRVLGEGDAQRVLTFDGSKLASRFSPVTRGYRDQTDASWYTGQLRASQPNSTPIPSSASRARLLKRRVSTPDDDIEDLPPSYQPELAKTDTLVTPPKTSPTPAPKTSLQDADGIEDAPNADTDASLPPDEPQRQLTAEEHNAILLRDPNIRKSTVVDPTFLDQYYRESRLHHLSTWKADLKSQLQALASEQTASQKAKQKRTHGTRRYILHVDFDSFFAAVSLKKAPQHKDKPAVVAHGQGCGSEIASCNYPARKFGVKNGMWMKRALEICPDLKILPYDFPAYEEASRAFYGVILATGGLVQSVSIDEALIDVSTLCINMSDGCVDHEQAKAEEITQGLREQVKERTGCDVSVGIGGNILLAKVALRRAKPAGQHQIKPEDVLDFIGELKVQDLPGIAGSIGGKLEELGVKLVKDIRKLTRERLAQTLGPKTGEKLWEFSRGIDTQEVGEQVVRKSVSAEVNWGVRFENQEQADEFIASLCGELQKRLLKQKVKGSQFTMKIMRRSPDAPLDPPKHLGHGKCDTFNKSTVLGVATNAKEVFTREALGILRGFGFTPGELRGIGVQVTKLEPMKSATDGSVESSQRRLQFKTKPVAASPCKVPAIIDSDPIQDDPQTPRKTKSEDDRVAFGAESLNHSTPSRRPLNMMGTQFIMPTQVDPRVLAELPEDIRSKLLRQTRQSSPTPASRKAGEPTTPSKATPFALTALPAQSQLDPEILAALPPDVREEIIAQYSAPSPFSPSRRPRHADQTILPQSPRKNRIIGIAAKKPIVPVKRGRGRPPKSAMLAAAAQATAISKDCRTLTQANFISRTHPARKSSSRSPSLNPAVPAKQAEGQQSRSNSDPDPEFLAALPADLRTEILAEHKRGRVFAAQPTHALTKPKPKPKPPFSLPAGPAAAAAAALAAPAQQKAPQLTMPRPHRPTFTTAALASEGALRAALREWVREFAAEGPYSEDVRALGAYLGKVVVEERDLSKAVGLVRWLEWAVGGSAGRGGEGWVRAVDAVKGAVDDAARERGLGRVRFD